MTDAASKAQEIVKDYFKTGAPVLENAIAAAISAAVAEERERAAKLVELLVKETKYWHEHCDGCSLDTRVAFCPDDHCAEASRVISAYEVQP